MKHPRKLTVKFCFCSPVYVSAVIIKYSLFVLSFFHLLTRKAKLLGHKRVALDEVLQELTLFFYGHLLLLHIDLEDEYCMNNAEWRK